MKSSILRYPLVVIILLMAAYSYAQPPGLMNYQSIAKDPQGNPAKNRDVFVKTLIYQTAPAGSKVWEESHLAKTNDDGIYTIVIGTGTRNPSIPISSIAQIDWGNGPYFLNIKVAVAPSIPAAWWVAADNYLDMGTTQMMSVPYAMFAGNASVTNVTTSLPPGQPNTFLVTDSAGNVNWAPPQAAGQSVTTVTELKVSFSSSTGQNVQILENSTSVVTVNIPGVLKGDPILVAPQDDNQDWTVYSAWVDRDDFVKIRFANYTDKPVLIQGSQYKVVVIK